MTKRYHYITPDDYRKAELFGIHSSLLEERVRKLGWDIEKAATTKKEQTFEYSTKMVKLAQRNDISIEQFRHRIRVNGWTEYDAATVPNGQRRGGLWSKFTPEQIATAESNGISATRFRQRVTTYKWSIEDAMTIPIMTNKEVMKNAQESSSWGKTNQLAFIKEKTPVATDAE